MAYKCVYKNLANGLKVRVQESDKWPSSACTGFWQMAHKVRAGESDKWPMRVGESDKGHKALKARAHEPDNWPRSVCTRIWQVTS